MFFSFFLCLIYNTFITGRYRVDDVQQDNREDCYLATLHITDANMQDARPYYLVVENERGTDRHAITLQVEGMFAGLHCFFIILIIIYLFLKPILHHHLLSFICSFIYIVVEFLVYILLFIRLLDYL